MENPKYECEAKMRSSHSKCAELVDTIELRVKLDKKLYNALLWHVKHTGNLLSDNCIDEFLSEWMTDSVNSYIERARDLSFYNGFP